MGVLWPSLYQITNETLSPVIGDVKLQGNRASLPTTASVWKSGTAEEKWQQSKLISICLTLWNVIHFLLLACLPFQLNRETRSDLNALAVNLLLSNDEHRGFPLFRSAFAFTEAFTLFLHWTREKWKRCVENCLPSLRSRNSTPDAITEIWNIMRRGISFSNTTGNAELFVFHLSFEKKLSENVVRETMASFLFGARVFSLLSFQVN